MEVDGEEKETYVVEEAFRQNRHMDKYVWMPRHLSSRHGRMLSEGFLTDIGL